MIILGWTLYRVDTDQKLITHVDQTASENDFIFLRTKKEKKRKALKNDDPPAPVTPKNKQSKVPPEAGHQFHARVPMIAIIKPKSPVSNGLQPPDSGRSVINSFVRSFWLVKILAWSDNNDQAKHRKLQQLLSFEVSHDLR